MINAFMVKCIYGKCIHSKCLYAKFIYANYIYASIYLWPQKVITDYIIKLMFPRHSYV